MTMNQFSSGGGLELANLVVSSDLLQHSLNKISDLSTEREANPNNTTSTSPVSLRYKKYNLQPDGHGMIIAFVASPVSPLQQEDCDLVSLEALRGSFPHLEFISTKVNPSFSIHSAAVDLFASVHHELSSLKDQVGKCRSLIVTGHSLGGSIASLFTLCLLDSIGPKATSHPLCITFGAPLLGNDYFRSAIQERPKWHSCFLHVVSDQDPIPKLVLPHTLSKLATESAPKIDLFKPFGTFLLCSKSGCACFEEPEITEKLMVATNSESSEHQIYGEGSSITHYKEILESLKDNAFCMRTLNVGESVDDPFRAGIIAQMEACGVFKTDQWQRQQEENDIICLIDEVVKKLKFVQLRSKNSFDPSKKLNERKIDMTYLEQYKRLTGQRDGYYDGYKKARFRGRGEIRSKEEIVKRQRILTQYWKKIVDEVEKKPQTEGASFRGRWLYAGTNYRRMVEPLDIAEYYMNGKRDYITQGRSNHYKLLEQWLKDDKAGGHSKSGNEKTKACSPTEDSCFWARVEDAIISCRVFNNAKSDPERKASLRNLIMFEEYVMDLIMKRAVCPEVFLEQSNFMDWWREYGKIVVTEWWREHVKIVGGSRHSRLAEFMKKDRKNYA